MAPSRSIAACERMLRASVLSATRPAPRSSNAYVNWSSFASLLIAVRQRDGASQVQPISSRSDGTSMSANRVDPTARPLATSTVAHTT